MKLEIENKALFAKNVLVVSLMVLLFACFLWQLRINLSLQQELNKKQEEFKEAASASKRLKKLQRQMQELEEQEKTINNKVPRNEKNPLGLVRTLTNIAADIGLRNAVFTIQESKKLEQEVMSLAQQQEGLNEDTSSPPKVLPAFSQGQSASPPPAGPSALKLEMSFAGTYAQVLNFLKRAAAIERVVAVEAITMERKRETLPYQQISLRLITYTF
jgi:Tfp pilus assembly protein PilO